MQNSPSTTVPISFIHDLLAAVKDAARCRVLVEKAGIPPALLEEGAARVTADQFSSLYRLVARALDDELPGMFSRPVRGGALKLLCLSMLESASLRIAMYRLSCFMRLICDDFSVEIEQQGEWVRVALVPSESAPLMKIFAQEVMLKLIHGVVSWLAGRKMPVARVDLSYSRPEHAPVYVFLYPGPANFDQVLTALYFESRDLDALVRQSKKTLTDFLRRAPADWLFVSFSERIVSHQVREYVEKHLDRHTGIADVARALHFSVRTLSRRLDAEGATFQAIKDELRRDIAIQRLTKTDMPIAVIGAEIGFDDPTTFHRAFKKWTGSTPGAYRSRPNSLAGNASTSAEAANGLGDRRP